MAAESPAAIKLVVGCLQQLRQAGQLEEAPYAQGKCACSFCQSIHACLNDPEAGNQSYDVQGGGTAWHVVQ